MLGYTTYLRKLMSRSAHAHDSAGLPRKRHWPIFVFSLH